MSRKEKAQPKGIKHPLRAIPDIFEQLAAAEAAIAEASEEFELARSRHRMVEIRHEAMRKFCEEVGAIKPGQTAEDALCVIGAEEVSGD